MRSSFEELKAILIPPNDPAATGSPEQWAALEHRLGTRLPVDYKAFIATYGSGFTDTSFYVVVPFVSPPYDLESEIAQFRDSYREIYGQADYRLVREGIDSDVPKGLIPWAHGNDGGMAYWDTRVGDPERWTVIEELEFYWQEFPGGMIDMLVQAITGDYESIVYGSPPRKLPIRYRQHQSPE